MSEPRDLRDLIGDDVDPDELERLQRVHALLEQAGPPPELPPSLAHAAEPPSARVLPFPRRYRYTAVAAAAIAAVALFGAGYLVAGGPDPEPVETLAMSGAGGASAELAVFAKDEAGNWPMEIRVTGLAPGTYELWLTREGALAASCGVFAVAGDETTVPLNAPFKLREFDGWVVVPVGGEDPVLTT
jgi:hypothetical protein